MTRSNASASESRDLVFSSLIEHAIEVSSQWHDRTYRKGRWRSPAFEVPPDEHLGVPVMAHVTAVAMTVQRSGWEEEVVAAAFLHDVLEDGNFWGDHLSYDNLATVIGEEVARLVVFVSEDKFDSSGELIRWKQRKERYIEVIKTAPAGAIAISLADKLHNLWSINESLGQGVDVFNDAKRRKGLGAGPAEQDWFFSAVIRASTASDDPRLEPIREQLAMELERFRQLVSSLPN